MYIPVLILKYDTILVFSIVKFRKFLTYVKKVYLFSLSRKYLRGTQNGFELNKSFSVTLVLIK